MVSGNMGMPRLETKRSRVFGKIPDRDWDRRVWSGPDQVPIGLGLNFPNTTAEELVYDEFEWSYKRHDTCQDCNTIDSTQVRELLHVVIRSAS